MKRPSFVRAMAIAVTLVALVLVVGMVGLLLLYSTVRAFPPPFNAYASTDVVCNEAGANCDIESTFGVGDDPWPVAMYDVQVSFTPADWGVAAGEDVPIGAVVGKLQGYFGLGFFNNPCNMTLQVWFDPLMNCSKDTSDTVSYADQFKDTNSNGLKDGCEKYPDFLNTLFPGMTPRARYAGFTFIGVNVSLNLVLFEPGTSLPLPGLPPFTADKGYVSVYLLNFNDPTAPPVKNQVTDLCPPVSTATVDYGLTKDNPNTVEDESGYAWRTNPEFGGTYAFYGYAASIRDAAGDDIDNALDTCPHVANMGDPRVAWSGDSDNDGLDNACDPTPNEEWPRNWDPDGDGYWNRQDNCPLVANGRDILGNLIGPNDQLDSDYDRIGDVCDTDDWNGDGDITDPGEPTGFSPTVPNGDRAEVWFETLIEIWSPDSDGDGIPDVSDACPDQPEDFDGFQDADGCPEPCPGGDVNGDGRVDFWDVSLVARAFGSQPGQPRWNPAADLNHDGRVDLGDLLFVLRSSLDRTCRP